MKMHLRESRTSKFSGGTCPRTALGSKTLWAFGKYTRLLLLTTHLCKNLLKPETLILWNAFAEFSIRAGGQRNSPAISLELATYFSLEVTPVFFWKNCKC